MKNLQNKCIKQALALPMPSKMVRKTPSAKILKNELEWNVELFFVSYGVHIGIRSNDPAVLNYFSEYFPPGYEYTSSSAVTEVYSLIVESFHQEFCYQLYRAEEKLIETPRLGEVLDIFDSDLRLQIAIAAHDWLFVHAGVVSWCGKAILIPGRSFSGKTTLVAALVKAGAIYYSDEYAVFDSNGLLHPYSRPLSIRQTDGSPNKRLLVESFGGTVGTEPLRVGLVVHTQYQLGAEWNPSQISLGQTVLDLLDNTVVARLRPDFALPILASSVSNALTIQGQRGNADEMVIALLQRLES